MRKILTILVLFLVYSCGKSSENKIDQAVRDVCRNKESDCKISLQSIITEEWDYVIISQESLSLEDLNKLLGFDYPYFIDIARRIIFVKGNKVIYHEDKFPETDRVVKNEVVFEMKNSNFLKIERNNAIFNAKKENDYFVLTLQ
jgi:hypothetical protein